MHKLSTMNKLKARWQITSNYQLVIIFFVFAITGSSASLLSKPFLHLVGVDPQTTSKFFYWFLRIVLIFPFYQILLVFFGFIFGQFNFFWNFEKRMLNNLRLGFIADAIDKKLIK